MPNFAKSHAENIGKVCLVCFGPSDRPLSSGLKTKFTEFLCPNYDELAPFLPSGICNTHRVLLGDFPNRQQSIAGKELDYADLANEQRNLPPLTRSSKPCECRICHSARSKSKKPLLPKQNPGRPCPDLEPSTVTICTKCHTQIGKGLAHDCTRSNRRQNIEGSLTPRVKQQITSQTLKDLANPEDKTTSAVLGTHGRSMNVSYELGAQGETSSSSRQISKEAMKRIQVNLNLSDRKTLKAAQVIRAEMGAQSVEPNLRESMHQRNHILDDFFSQRKLPMLEKSKSEQGGIQTVHKDAVICHDVEGLISFLKTKRESARELLFKVGIDGGGGSLKVCLNAVAQPASTSGAQKKENASGFLDSGVKKLIILAIVPGASESNENVGTILRALNISSISFCLCSDLKLSNICVGKQSHASKIPCTWCSATAPYESDAPLYTLGKIRRNVTAFRDAGMPLRKAQLYENCVQMPLLEGPDSALVLDLIPPPELHLMLGVVNKIFDSLNEEWGEDRAYEWGAKNYIIRTSYRGGSMEGNQCRQLLMKLGLLEKALPSHLQTYTKALKDFDQVRRSCFGQTLYEDYDQAIRDFKDSFTELNIPVTPKLHALFVHVRQFCSKQNLSLGPFSEQSSESVHADFKAIWKHFSVDTNHPNFGRHLLSAILKYNSMHI